MRAAILKHQPPLLLHGGFDAGPLFEHGRVRRPPKPRMQSTYRNRVERARMPAWVDRAAIRRTFKQAQALTTSTGVRYSVDHIVPLNHPLVCGLHWHGNMAVDTLEANMRKGNRTWPDMWEVQEPLPLAANDEYERMAA